MVPLKSKLVRAIIGCILRACSFKANEKNTKFGISERVLQRNFSGSRQNIFGFTVFSNSHLIKHALGSYSSAKVRVIGPKVRSCIGTLRVSYFDQSCFRALLRGRYSRPARSLSFQV